MLILLHTVGERLHACTKFITTFWQATPRRRRRQREFLELGLMQF